MITIGIDAGTCIVKASLLNDSGDHFYEKKIIGLSSVASVTQETLLELVKNANVSIDSIDYITATGKYRSEISSCNERLTEPLCLVEGATRTLPSTKTILDIGSEKCLVIKCDQGRMIKHVGNDKCASGTGTFMETIADVIGVGIAELDYLAEQSKQPVEFTSVCTVFAESEVISLVHSGNKVEDIVGGAIEGFANNIYSLMLNLRPEKDIMVVGGIANNKSLVRALQHRIKLDLVVPDKLEYIGSLGAALIAKKRAESVK